LQDAVGKARDAIERGDFPAAVRELSASLGSDHIAFHNAILTLLDSSSCRNGKKLIEASLQHSHFDLNQHDSAGKTALDLAVRHNDRECADYLLCHGANPERTSLAAASAGMQELLTKWRWKKLLYAHWNKPPASALQRERGWPLAWRSKPDHGNRTLLDCALHDDRFDEANLLLQKELGGDSLEHCFKLWEKAMETGRHDVLRAMLILKQDALCELTKDQQKVGQWLDKLRHDPGLSAVLKEFPYQSVKRGEPKFLNCEAKFHNTQQRIECRHLATYQQEMQARHPRIKFDYEKFSDLDNITNHVKLDIEETYAALKAQASSIHLIGNNKFGQFLAKQFQEMEVEDKPAGRLMLVESTNHSMNLGLMIKKDGEGKKSHVVKFFDPNFTTTGTRSKAGSVQAFEMQTIDSYVADSDLLQSYYPEPKGLSIIFVRPAEDEKAVPTSVSTHRKLTMSIDIKDVDATAVWHLMYGGFAENLRQLGEHFKTLTEDQRFELLGRKFSFGVLSFSAPGLYTSMALGYAETVKAYGELLTLAQMSEDRRIELLGGKDSADNPALLISMSQGHAETIKAYGELLKQSGPISEDRRIELLAAKDGKNNPALYVGMQSGHAEAVKAYGELLKEAGPLLQDKLIELLAGEDGRKNPAIFIGMSQGHAEAVKAYGELLEELGPIPEDKLIGLLAGKNRLGNPALFVSMYRGHAEAVKAYGALLKKLRKMPEDKLIELIEGTSAHGTPALYIGMSMDHVEAVKAYGELVSCVPPDKQADLLLAKCGKASPLKVKRGLDIALEKKCFAAANAQFQLLHQLAPSLSYGKRAELLTELNGYEDNIANAISHTETDSSSLEQWVEMHNTFLTLRDALL